MRKNIICLLGLVLFLTGCGKNVSASVEIETESSYEVVSEEEIQEDIETNVVTEQESLAQESLEESEIWNLNDNEQWEKISAEKVFGKGKYIYELKKRLSSDNNHYKEEFILPGNVEGIYVFFAGSADRESEEVTILIDGFPFLFKLNSEPQRSWLLLSEEKSTDSQHSIEVYYNTNINFVFGLSEEEIELNNKDVEDIDMSGFNIRDIKDYDDMDKIEVPDVFGKDKGYRFKKKGMAMTGFTESIQIAVHTDVMLLI